MYGAGEPGNEATAWLVNSRFWVCTSLIPRPLTVVFGLGTRLCVHAYKIRKWCPTQRTAAGQYGVQLYRPVGIETVWSGTRGTYTNDLRMLNLPMVSFA